MESTARTFYNENFSDAQYQAFLQALEQEFPGAIAFRLAETPVFIPRDFLQQMLDCCQYIIDQMQGQDFIQKTQASIPPAEFRVEDHTHCHTLIFDFAVCADSKGEWTPKLIELQGFPSLFAFQAWFPEIMKEHLPVPAGYTQYLSGLNRESYLALLRQTILGTHPANEVVLLEIKPEEQKTKIDFYCTQLFTGIKSICVSDLKADGNRLYYEDETGKNWIRRIYNRVIMDEFHAVKDSFASPIIDLFGDYQVEWVPHPNWFYRLSKYTMPLLNHPAIPHSVFVSDLKEIPTDLSSYVLKPLFSFAGQGVVIDVTQEDVAGIENPGHWILQEKVDYADAIPTPDGPAKVEIRLMYLWPETEEKPVPAINLARISKGKMIGTRYNLHKTWVGGSVGFVPEM